MSSTTQPYGINGFPVVVSTSTTDLFQIEAQYTSLASDLSDKLKSVYQQLIPGTFQFSPQPTQAQVNSIAYDIGNLLSMARNGYEGQNLTPEMASKLQNVLDSLIDAGIIDNSGNVSLLSNGSLALTDLSNPSISAKWNTFLSKTLAYSTDPTNTSLFTSSPSNFAYLSLNDLFGADTSDDSWLTGVNNTVEDILTDFVGTGGTPSPDAIIDLAGVAYGVDVSVSGSSQFTGLMNTIQNVLNNAGTAQNLYNTLTGSQIAALSGAFGKLISLAQAGNLSSQQVGNLNVLLSSLSNYSTTSELTSNIIASTPGWSIDSSVSASNGSLLGVSQAQWQTWFQALVSNPSSVSPAIQLNLTVPGLFSLTPLVIGNQSFDVASVYADGNSGAQISGYISQLQAAIVTATNNNDAQGVVNALNTYLPLIFKYLNTSNSLSKIDFNNLQAIIPSLTTGLLANVNAQVLNISGLPYFVIPNPTQTPVGGVTPDQAAENALSLLNSQILLAFQSFDPTTNLLTANSFSAVSTLVILATSGTLSAAELAKVNVILDSLSKVSSSAVVNVAPIYAPYDPNNPGVLNLTPAQWQAWLEQIAFNPDEFSSVLGVAYTFNAVTYAQVGNGPVSFSTSGTLVQNFNNILSGIQQSLNSTPALQAYIGQLIYYAKNGDGNGNYLTPAEGLIVKGILASLSQYSQSAVVGQGATVSWTLTPGTNTYTLSQLTSNPALDDSIWNAFKANPPSPITTQGGTLLDLAGVFTPVTTGSGSNAFYSAILNLVTYFNPSIVSLALSGNSSIINNYRFFVGVFITGAQSGTFSPEQISVTNIILQSLSNFSSTNAPLFPQSVSAGWSVDNDGYLQGVSDDQIVAWLQSIQANPQILSPIFSYISQSDIKLRQGVAFNVNGVLYNAPTETLTQSPALESSFTALLNTLKGAVAAIRASGINAVPSSAQVSTINNAMKQLIPLALHGDGNNNYLTAPQINELQSVLSGIPDDGIHEEFISVAGIQNYVLAATSESGAATAAFNASVTAITNILKDAVGPNNLTQTQIDDLGSNVNALVQQALIPGTLSITHLTNLNILLKSLSSFSTNAVDPVTAFSSYTPGWGVNSNFLNPDLNKNNYAWNTWFQSISSNALALQPLLSFVTVSLFYYDFNAVPISANVQNQPDPNVTATYNADLIALQTIIQAMPTTSSPTIPDTALNQAMGQLITLAFNGDGNGNYLTIAQATALNQLISSLNTYPALSGITTTISLDQDPVAIAGMTTPAWAAWYQTLLSTNLSQPILDFSLGFPGVQSSHYYYSLVYSPDGSQTPALTASLNTILDSISTVLHDAALNPSNSGLTPAQVSTLSHSFGQYLLLATKGDGLGHYLSISSIKEADNLQKLLTTWTQINFTGTSLATANVSADWNLWYSAVFNTPNSIIAQETLNPAPQSLFAQFYPPYPYTLNGVTVSYPINYFPNAGSAVDYNTDINSLNALLKSIADDPAHTVPVAQLNQLIGNMLALAQAGTNVTPGQAAVLNELFKSLNTYPAASGITTTVSVDGNNSLVGMTPAAWQAWYNTVVANYPPAFLLTIPGTNVPVSVSPDGTQTSALTAQVSDLRNSIQSILANAERHNATLSNAQIQQLNTYLGQYLLLAQVGDGQGNYLSSHSIGDLQGFFNSFIAAGITSFSVSSNPVALTGVSNAQWATWATANLSPNGDYTLPVTSVTFTVNGGQVDFPVRVNPDPTTTATVNGLLDQMSGNVAQILGGSVGPGEGVDDMDALVNQLYTFASTGQLGQAQLQKLAPLFESFYTYPAIQGVSVTPIFQAIAVPSGAVTGNGTSGMGAAGWTAWVQQFLATSITNPLVDLNLNFVTPTQYPIQGTNLTAQVSNNQNANLTAALNTVLNNLMATLQSADGTNTLTDDQIQQLQTELGQYVFLAQRGDGISSHLTTGSVGILNALLSKLAANQVPPITFGLVGTSLLSTISLTGVSGDQWKDFYADLYSDPTYLAANGLTHFFYTDHSYSYTLNGLSTPATVSPVEFPSVTAQLNNDINAIVPILNSITLDPNGPVPSAALNQALGALLVLVQNGDGNGGFLTAAQAATVDSLLQTLNTYPAAAGITTTVSLDGSNALVGMSDAAWSAWYQASVSTPQTFFTELPDVPPVASQVPNTTFPINVSASGALLSPALIAQASALTAQIQAFFQSLTSTSGSSPATMTHNQIAQLNVLFGQYGVLAQNGDGQGNYLPASSMQFLKNMFTSLANHAISLGSASPYAINLTTVSGVTVLNMPDSFWNDWYPSIMNDLAAVRASGLTNVLYPQYTYTAGNTTFTGTVYPPYVSGQTVYNFNNLDWINGLATPMGNLEEDIYLIAAKFIGPSDTKIPPVLTSSEIQSIKSHIGQIISFAQNGFGHIFPTTGYANNLNTLFQSLSAYAPDLSNISDDQITQWYTSIFNNPSSLSTEFGVDQNVNFSPDTTLSSVLTYSVLQQYAPKAALVGFYNVPTPPITDQASIDSFNVNASQFVYALNLIKQQIPNFGPSTVLTDAQVANLRASLVALTNMATNALLTAPMLAQVNQLTTGMVNAGFVFGGNGDGLTTMTNAQWSTFYRNFLANPTSFSGIVTTSPITIAGQSVTTFSSALSTTDATLVSDYNATVNVLKTVLKQFVAGGGTLLSSSELNALNQVAAILINLAAVGENNSALTAPMVTGINTLLASISQFSKVASAGGAASTLTSGWAVSGGTLSGVSPTQWRNWAAAVVANPSSLSPLLPPDFLEGSGVEVPVGLSPLTLNGQTIGVGTVGTMSAANLASYNQALQDFKNKALGYAKAASNGATAASYLAGLRSDISTLMGLATNGSLTVSAVSAVNTLFTSLSGVTALNEVWTPANVTNGTALNNAELTTWLNQLASGLINIIPVGDTTSPQVTINLSNGLIVSVPYSVNPSANLLSQYNALTQDIKALLSAPGTVTNSENQLAQDIGTLLHLSQYGDGSGSFFNTNMQTNISLLAASLTASGAPSYTINPNGDGSYSVGITDITFWQTWRSLALSSNLLSSLLSQTVTTTPTRSLQAMVELNYVKLGNEMLAGQLSGLQQALETTQTVLDTLTGLQNIHNQLVVSTKIPFSTFFVISNGMKVSTWQWTNPITQQVFGGQSGLGFQAAYKYYASAYFNATVAPSVAIPPGGVYDLPPGAATTWILNAIATGQINIVPVTFDLIHGGKYIGYQINLQQTSDGGDATGLTQVNIPQYVIDAYGLSTGVNLSGNVLVPSPASNKPILAYYTSPGSYSGDFPDNYRPPTSAYLPMKNLTDLYSQLVSKGYTFGNSNQEIVINRPASGDPLGTAIQSALGGIPTGLASTLQNLLYNKAILSAQVARLSALSPSSVTSPNSLYSMTKKVLQNLSAALVTSSGTAINDNTTYVDAYFGLRKWLLDGYQTPAGTTTTNTAGAYQQNITFAVTAAESLNSRQQQQVSNYLYVFEQFEKSAAAILQQLTQIIQNIAQNIAR